MCFLIMRLCLYGESIHGRAYLLNDLLNYMSKTKWSEKVKHSFSSIFGYFRALLRFYPLLTSINHFFNTNTSLPSEKQLFCTKCTVSREKESSSDMRCTGRFRSLLKYIQRHQRLLQKRLCISIIVFVNI